MSRVFRRSTTRTGVNCVNRVSTTRMAGTHSVLELHGGAVRGGLRLEGTGQFLSVPVGAVVARGQSGLQNVSGEFCRASTEWVERAVHMQRRFHRSGRRPVFPL